MARVVPLHGLHRQSGVAQFFSLATANPMRTPLLILLVVLTGCSHSASRAEKLSRQIQQWVPDGTPLAAARQMMQQHQFKCSVISFDNAEQMTNSADAVLWKTIVVRDGQHFAVTNVSHLECKTPQCGITFSVVNGETVGFTAGGSL